MSDYPSALRSLRPGAEWTLRGNDLSGLEWHDKAQTRPTDEEIETEVKRLDALPPDQPTPVDKLRDFLAANPDVAQMLRA